MSIFEVIGLLAGIVQIVGYVWYISYVVRGVIKPNTGSWLIWAYGNAIVCWSYIAMGNELTFRESLPFICSIFSFIAAIIFLFLRRFEKPTSLEIKILLADIAITAFWLLTGESAITQVLLQVSVIISFFPIVKETKDNPSNERPGPWVVWTVAYILLFFAEFPQGFWMWIYPLQYLIWHGIMGILSAKSRPSLT